MKLEEAIKILQKLLEQYNLIDYRFNNMLDFEETDAIETVLNYIENSVPKEVIIDKIRERQFELQQEYKDFKNDIKLNTLQEILAEK